MFKYHNKLKLNIIFIFLLLQLQSAFAQCGIFVPKEIQDLNTTALTLLVSNAANNTLGENGQGVCLVKVKFKHQVVGDINMVLIAPNGQSIQLVGYAGDVSSPTSFITWDVSFVPSASPAAPDPGIGDTWNNDELWTNSIGRVYDGSYYPNDGSFEFFDGGTVNGSWILLIEDVVENDAGIIESFSIVFCDETSIECNECLPNLLTPVKDTIELCKGTMIDENDLKFNYNVSNPDTTNYKNDFLIFGQNQFKGRLSNVNEASLAPANYKLCAVNYHIVDSISLPSSPLLKDTLLYKNAINLESVCARIGECIDLVILPVTDTIIRNYEICKGETLTAYGNIYADEGKYFTASVVGKCDTLVEINLDVVDLEVSFTQNFPLITCVNKEIQITANTAEQGKLITYNWSTVGGNIVSTNNNIIRVNAAGIYIVESTYKNCNRKDTINIDVDINIPDISLNANEITCENEITTIFLVSSLPIITADWIGNGIVSQTGFNLQVNQPGLYTVTTEDGNGCNSVASILVAENKIKPTITFDHDSIRCQKNTFKIVVKDSSYIRSTFVRFNNTIINDALNRNFSDPGNYTLFIVGFNGCIDSTDFIVEDLRYVINVSVPADTLTCEKKFIITNPTTDRPVNNFNWSGPENVLDVAKTTITKPGLFTLLVTDANQCTGQVSVNFVIDTIAPALVMSGKIIGCDPDSVLLIADDYNPNLNYVWSGNNLSSNQDSVYVKIPNVYSVVATDKNQCTKQVFFNVAPAMNLPDVEFAIESIECLKTTAKLTPNKTTGFTFQWVTANMLNASTDPFGNVNVSGTYQVRVTNSLGCYRNYALAVGDIRQKAMIEIMADTIGCNDDSIQIKLDIDIDYQSIEWRNSSALFSTLEDPYVMDGGDFFVEIVDSFGCIFFDTINVFKDLSIAGITTTSTTITCDSTFKKITAQLNENGATYSWSLNNEILGNSDSLFINKGGRYKVVVQNLRGCIDSAFVDVGYDTIKSIINILPYNVLDCDNLSVPIKSTVSNAIKEFSWTGTGITSIDANNAYVNMPGDFTYTIKDSRDCIASKTFNIADSSKYTIVNINKKDVTCDSVGIISLNFTGTSNSIIWNAPISIPNNSKIANASKAGNYKFTLTNNFGCKTIDSIDIALDTIKPKITQFINGELNCEKAIIDIGVASSSAIEKITWNNSPANSLIISVNKKGTYTGKLIGFNGCITDFSVIASENISKPVITIIGDTIDCKRSKIDLLINTPDSLRSVIWLGPNMETFNGKKVKITKSGKYIASVVGANGCITVDSIVIEDKKVFPFVALQDTFLLPCNGDSIELFITTQDTITTYRWISESFYSNDAKPFTNDTGQMILLLGTINGCVYTDTTNLIIDPRRPIFSFINDTITCNPSFATITPLNIEDDSAVFWKDSSGIITSSLIYNTSQAGNHYLIVEATNTCKDSILFEILIDTIYPDILIEQSELFGCDHLTVELFASISETTNFDFNWSTLDGNFVKDTNTLSPSINAGGLYSIEVINHRNNCISKDSILVSGEVRKLNSITINHDDPICFNDVNGSLTINNISGGIQPYIITINGNENENPVILNNLFAGDYFINISDSFGCLLDTVILLNNGFDYSVYLPQDTLIDIGYDIDLAYQVEDTINIVSSNWVVDELNICNDCETLNLSPITSITIHLDVTNDLGCKAEDEIVILVNNKIAFDLPNAFSPLSNTGNEKFFVPDYPGIKEVIKLDIYDNWGNVVFSKSNFPSGIKEEGWDGTFNGKQLNPGVFVMYLDVILLDDSRLQFYRDLTLLR